MASFVSVWWISWTSLLIYELLILLLQGTIRQYPLFFYSRAAVFRWTQQERSKDLTAPIRVPETWVLSKAQASVPPLLSPSWSLNFNGTLILCWDYSFWMTQKPEQNMEQNKNESWQWTRIIIPGLFLIGFQGIYNTWIQSLVPFSVLQQRSSGIMRQQAEHRKSRGWKQDTSQHNYGLVITAAVVPLLCESCQQKLPQKRINQYL